MKAMGMIVSYNPEIELLETNIAAILPQVDELVVYDNCSKNVDEVEKLCAKHDVLLIKNEKNLGIAEPLHDGVLLAKQKGYPYILTLDQDSEAYPDMVSKLKASLDKDERTAMVGPAIVPRSKAENASVTEDKPMQEIQKQVLITSGALARVDAILEVGNYIKEMIIDLVDYEICFRLSIGGYLMKMNPEAVLLHQLGYPSPKRILFKTIHPSNYSAFRLYYQARNLRFCCLKYASPPPPQHASAHSLYPQIQKSLRGYKKDLNKRKLKMILAESDKIKKLKAIKRGWKDGKQFYKEFCKKNMQEDKR